MLMFSRIFKFVLNSPRGGIFSHSVNVVARGKSFHSFKSLKMVLPTKSPNDKKDYRIITLTNGLKALLISEPDDGTNDVEEEVSDSGEGSADESEGEEAMESECSDDENVPNSSCNMNEKLAAAAICVGIGNFCDPSNIGGLAHYLEHMVFMGSKKYPDENKFDAFTKLHGGSNNASTDCERTIFQFEVTQKYFKESLDILAQFFIEPLMKIDSMDRELQAVESEYQMNFPNDYFRKQHVFSTFARNGHPMGNFMWGNVHSLKTLPEKDNINIYSNLQEFRKKYYSAQFMTLVVQARASLDTLQEWVEEIFSKVPNNGEEKPTHKHLQGGFQTPQFHKLYKIVPVSQIHQVVLSWVLPSLVDNYREKPLDYLGWLVGHEGRGSILSYLRKRVWALEIYGGNDGSGMEHNSTGSMFSITVKLTEEGLNNLFEVITVILEYLEMLRNVGPNERIYKEIQTIENNDFLWQEEVEPIDNVENLSEGMHVYLPEDYLTGDSLLMKYDPELIKQCQDALTPGQMNIMVLSPRFEAESVNFTKEQWSDAPYEASDIDSNWIEAWKDLKPRPELHVPEPNKFIATDFTLTSEEADDTEFPVALVQDDFGQLWFKRDTKFKSPKIHINYQLSSSIAYSSPENAVMMDMLVQILDQNLKDEAYDADIAQLKYSFSPNEYGLVLKTYGFNHKLPILFFTIIQYIIDFEVTDEFFEGIKDQLLKTYYNSYIKPKYLCRDVRLSILQSVHWTTVERRAVAPKITKSMLLDFVNVLKPGFKLKGLIQGNICRKNAMEIHEKLKKMLNIKETSRGPLEMQVTKLPVQPQICKVRNFNGDDSNSVITNYYQCGPSDVKNVAMMDLVIMCFEEPCFDNLRTKEQLSYHVSPSTRDTYGIVGITILVCPQAEKFSCSYVDGRIEVFITEFLDIISKFSDEEFHDQVQSLIKLRQCSDLYLKEEVDRNWREIESSYYLFNRREKEVECLKSFTLKDLQSWCQKHLGPSGELRQRKLSIQVVGKGIEEPENESCLNKDDSVHVLENVPYKADSNYKIITDIPNTKKSMSLYPVSKVLC